MLDATKAWSHHVTDAAQLAGSTPASSSRRRRARAPTSAGGLGAAASTSRPTSRSSPTPSPPALRRAFYEAWTTRASDRGPSAGRFDNSAGDRGHPAAAARGGAAARLRRTTPSTRSPTAWRARVAEVIGLPAASSPRGHASRRRGASSPSSRPSPAGALERLGRRLLFRAAAAEPLLGLAGGAARRTCRCRACSRACSRSPSGCTACASSERQRRAGAGTRTCATSRCATADGAPLGELLPRCLRARRTSAAAPGWTSCVGRKRLDGGQRAAGRLPGVQFAAARARGQPALLTHDDVVTLFHEFGHGAAPPADARRLPEPRRHQRRRLGRGRAAEPVHGELRLAARGAAAHLARTPRAARRCPRR